MSDTEAIKKKLFRRLMPLYIGALFQGFVLWYAIEKLFMRSIGFDDATIGIMVAAYSAIVLLVETPSGVIADRWSRKGVLIFASIFLIISSLLGGFSNNIYPYILANMFWGVFYALYSGTYESIVYDTLYEETGNSRRYEFFYGRIRLIDSLAMVFGSLIGGIVASQFGLRETYFLTIPITLISIVALLKFKEPTLHKTPVAIPIKDHLRATLRAVLRNRALLPIILILTTLAVLVETLLEFNQLWLIALAMPVYLFGPANAAVLAGLGIGGTAADYLKLRKYHVAVVGLIIMVLSALGLVVLRSAFWIVIAQVVLCIVIVGFTVVFNRILHDSLSSTVRAGAASAVSTFSRMILIPLALLFGYLSEQFSIFHASWLLLAVAALTAIMILKAAGKNNRTGLEI